MKSLFLAIAFIFTAVEAQGAWRYVPHDGRYFTRVNELGVTDPYYWTYSNCCGYSQSTYRVPATVQAQSVQYNKNWKESIVNAVHAKQENEQFRAALAESGLASGNGYAQGQQSTGNYSSLSVIQQGASTLYGPQQATVSPFGQYDPMAVANMINKSAENNLSVSHQLSTGLAVTNQQVLNAQTEVEKFKAFANALGDAAVKTQTNQTITTQTTSNSSSAGTGGTAEQNPLVQRHPNALANIKGQVAFQQNCLKCHGGVGQDGNKVVKGNLDLSDLSLIPNRDEFAEQAWKLMNHRNEAKRMPAGGAKLPATVAAEIFSYLRGD